MATYATHPLMGSIPINDTTSYMVLINGEPAPLVEAGSLTVDSTIGKRGQASFTIHTTDTATHYQQYQLVDIFDSNNTLAFSGYITNPQEQKPGFQASLNHKITCADKHYLADKRIIAKSYTARTRSSIVADIAQTVLAQEGVTIGAIVDEAGNVATLYPATNLYPNTTLYPQGSPTTGLINAVFAYCTAAQALDELTKDASQAGIPYYWTIDQYNQFWWVPYTYQINSTVIDGTLVDQANGQTSVSRQNPMYRNQQYILGGTAQTTTQTETRIGDSNTQSWAMGYALASAPTITVDGTVKAVGVKGVDSSKDFYWQLGDPTITQDSSGTKLTSSNTLQVVYTGQYPTVIVANNNAQISYQSALDASSGLIEEVEQVPTIQSLSDGLAKATGLLSRYAVQGTQLQIEQRGNDAGYAPGQLVTVNLPMHGLSNTQMLIEEVSASDQRDGINIWYVIKLVAGPYDQTWIDFFGAVVQQQQPSNSINVGASQSLVLLQQFSANLSPTATLNTNVYACPIPSSTLFPSTTLYPC